MMRTIGAGFLVCLFGGTIAAAANGLDGASPRPGVLPQQRDGGPPKGVATSYKGKDPEVRKLSAADQSTLRKLHEDNVREIGMGQIGVKQASAREVRDYARVIVEDHQAADRDLATFVETFGLTLAALEAGGQGPAKEAVKTDEHHALGNTRGESFDREFATSMLQGHLRAIDRIQTARQETKDPQVKAFLGKLLPALEKHRTQAQDLVDRSRS